MYLLDTNIISELRRPEKADSRVVAWMAKQQASLIHTSVVVLMELERGILGMERKDVRQGAVLRRWLTEVVLPAFGARVLPIDATTAAICAGLHIPDRVPENDAWIAASSLQHGLTLVTRNSADFANTGVNLLNPFAA